MMPLHLPRVWLSRAKDSIGKFLSYSLPLTTSLERNVRVTRSGPLNTQNWRKSWPRMQIFAAKVARNGCIIVARFVIVGPGCVLVVHSIVTFGQVYRLFSLLNTRIPLDEGL